MWARAGRAQGNTSATSADLNVENEDGFGWREGSHTAGQPGITVARLERQQASPRVRLSHQAIRLCSRLRVPVG